eukprot:GFKZ01011240.1.p1 GENE.GFKZ01011240.1~~GFKZ01011240.1.p1  ORF type:complete len:126 (-),score=3.88 GFKZ01011240.1:505-882(-)
MSLQVDEKAGTHREPWQLSRAYVQDPNPVNLTPARFVPGGLLEMWYGYDVQNVDPSNEERRPENEHARGQQHLSMENTPWWTTPCLSLVVFCRTFDKPPCMRFGRIIILLKATFGFGLNAICKAR